ncbi:6,7-dimethyl-8-ribityllumazine synthase [Buchnera aphidicola]|uniref:6,7-dimethyl-8-ribityllumazine synthase n=1 Tax=Buchnera aphidicola TaxID=9 RepID=UPI003464E88A
MSIIQGKVTSETSKIAIIISRFNEFINENLLRGAVDTLNRIGNIHYNNITVIKIPGAYEIPIIANKIASLKKYDGIITLGTIIKGETMHFEILSGIVSTKISEISINHNIPITLGILITNTIEQAINRAGNKFGNKGNEAALSLLETINVLKIL